MPFFHVPHQHTNSEDSDHPVLDVEKGPKSEALLKRSSTWEKPDDPNIVWWDGPNDPQNPRNWSTPKKVINVGLISLLCFITPVASAMFAPGIPKVMQDFHNNNDELASFVVSIFVLGFALGPIILAPLSEIYGRQIIYFVMNVLFVTFTMACALSNNLGMLIGFRFLAGAAGSTPLANGGGTISDLIEQERRGAAMAIFGVGPLLGPVIGPVAGGYLAQAEGWRWVFWVIVIAGGLTTILFFILLSETYAPVILQRKTLRLQKETGNLSLKSKLDTGLSVRSQLKHAIVRPAKLLLFSPIVLSLSVFQGLCFGCLYLLFTTFSMVYTEQYHWDTGKVGLSFLGLGIGCTISLIIFGSISDQILKYKAGKGELKPEYRLLPMIPATIFISAGLFWYGWSAQAKAHWIVPILGTVLVGFGYLPVIMCTQTYLVDAYEKYSASALAASTVLRSLMGATIPLAGRSMYAKMGLGWGNSMLAFITLAMLPLPWVFYRYGEGLRKRFKVDL